MVEVRGLTRRFGSRAALDDVTLSIPAGTVLGLVGANGAGKTTLIRHLLGLLKAQAGRVRVFGLDPVADPAGVLARIGYLSEEPDLPGWMRVEELLRYTRAFHPAWDEEYAAELVRQFGLGPAARLRDLSKGQRARAGLTAALAHRPELLVLDEPSSGLDPLVRREILAAVLRAAGDAGRTVLFSSHLLAEVERVADRIAMIHAGRIVFDDCLEALQERHQRVTLGFAAARPAPPPLAGAIAWDGGGREWTAVWSGPAVQLEAEAALAGARVLDRSGLSLDEIFVAYCGGGRGEG